MFHPGPPLAEGKPGSAIHTGDQQKFPCKPDTDTLTTQQIAPMLSMSSDKEHHYGAALGGSSHAPAVLLDVAALEAEVTGVYSIPSVPCQRIARLALIPGGASS